MEYNYLYVDDVDSEQAQGTTQALEKTGVLAVFHENPTGNWEKQRARFLDGSFSVDYQGLILDLRLEDYANSHGDNSFYKGTSLAQELRTSMKEGLLVDVPIILLSATNFIEKSFDSTGYDLFDLIVSKESLNGDQFTIRRRHLVGLAHGYKLINAANRENPSEAILDILSLKDYMFDVRLKSKLMVL